MANAPRDDNQVPAILGSDGTTTRAIKTDTDGNLQVDVLSGTITTTESTSTTATTTSVADNAANVTLLAANTSRKGASITNDSSARLHIKMGATATTSSYGVSLAQHGYFEVPFKYTGIIDGIWASDPGDGAARIVEYT